MSRKVLSSGGTGAYPAAAVDAGPDGMGGGTAAPTWNQTYYRSNDGAVRYAASVSGTSWREWVVAPSVGQTLYARRYVHLEALPTSAAKILWFGTAAGLMDLVSVRLTAAGKLQLWNEATGVQIGADSPAALSLLTWYRVGLALRIDVGATDYAELRLAADGVPDTVVAPVVVASLPSGTISETQPTRFGEGWGTAPGNTTAHQRSSDVAVNDPLLATSQNTWPGEGHVGITLGYRFFSRQNWTTCEATLNTDPVHVAQAVSTVPPVGHADATADTVPHQLRCPANTLSNFITGHHTYAWHGLFGDSVAEAQTAIDTAFGDANSSARFAGSFTINGTTDPVIDVWLKAVGAPTDDVRVQVMSSIPYVGQALNLQEYQPSEQVLAEAIIPSAQIGSAYAWISVNIGSLTPVARGRYWLVFSRMGAYDPVNYYATQRVGGTVAGVDRLSGWFNELGAPGAQWLTTSAAFLISRIRTTAGVSRLNAVQAFACHGEGDALNAATGKIGHSQWPAIAQGAFNYGDHAGAAGAFPGNNWRWATTPIVEDVPMPSADVSPEPWMTKDDLTTAVGLLCMLGTHFDYSQPFATPWRQFRKTADSTLWWARRVVAKQVVLDGTGASVTINPGNWILAADPLTDASAYSEETDANILTLYTATGL